VRLAGDCRQPGGLAPRLARPPSFTKASGDELELETYFDL